MNRVYFRPDQTIYLHTVNICKIVDNNMNIFNLLHVRVIRVFKDFFSW